MAQIVQLASTKLMMAAAWYAHMTLTSRQQGLVHVRPARVALPPVAARRATMTVRAIANRVRLLLMCQTQCATSMICVEICLLATLEWCWHAFVTHVLLPSPANLFCVYAVQDQKLCEQFMGPRARSGVYNITLRGEQYQVGESCRHASHLLGACAGWLPRACVVHACCRHQHSLRSGFVRHM